MTNDKDLKQAEAVYKSLREMLEERNWHYENDDENMAITCMAQGDDLPIEIIVQVDREHQIVSLFSKMPYAIPEDRRTALAIAVSQANNGLIDGSFDFDYLNGRIIFRLTSSYRESLIGKELFTYMLMCACYTIDEYNDKFLMIAKNKMTAENILDFIK
jgi:hypothetical protein